MNSSAYRAFFFDLDGTLIDSEIIWVRAVADAIRMRGGEIDQERAETLTCGKSWKDIFSEIQRDWPGLYESIEDIQPITEQIYSEIRAANDIGIPGSVALLRRLAGDFPVAIVSGSTRGNIANAMRDLQIESAVKFYLGCEDYAPGKPHPACYLKAAARLKIEPRSCCVFEDSWAGITAAKRACMTAIAIARPGAPVQDVSDADEVYTDLSTFWMDP